MKDVLPHSQALWYALNCFGVFSHGGCDFRERVISRPRFGANSANLGILPLVSGPSLAFPRPDVEATCGM